MGETNLRCVFALKKDWKFYEKKGEKWILHREMDSAAGSLRGKLFYCKALASTVKKFEKEKAHVRCVHGHIIYSTDLIRVLREKRRSQ